MVRIKRLRPAIPHWPPAPQCSAIIKRMRHWGTDVSGGYWQSRTEKCMQKGWNVEQCTHHASYLFNRKPYCTAHAGRLALNLLEKISDAPGAPHSKEDES